MRRLWRQSRRGVPKKERAWAQRGGMWELLERYLEHLGVRHYSERTVRSSCDRIARFLSWCDERAVSEATDVTQPIVERFQRWLYYYRKSDGHPLALGTQLEVLGSVKQFFRWTTRAHLTLFNPAAEIELPRLPSRLPRDVLTVAQVEAVLAQPDLADPLGVRDRAMLETLYATGVRRMELANLAVYDLDAGRGTLFIREGKGKRDRVVPIGRRALDWLEKYVTGVRPELVVDTAQQTLFLTADGGPFAPGHLGALVKRYLRAAGVQKAGACHVFRHTMATLMLENGADVRFIQEMLGHRKLSTTAVYTHVSIAKLKQIYEATHPAQRAEPGAVSGKIEGATAPAAARELLAQEVDGEEREEGPAAGGENSETPPG